jgi:hypothetical protein
VFGFGTRKSTSKSGTARDPSAKNEDQTKSGGAKPPRQSKKRTGIISRSFVAGSS